jgi:predicted amidohydrolase
MHQHATARGPAAFRLGMVQMRVDGGCPEENLARAEARIDEAAEAGARVILLPEALNLGWTHPSAATAAEVIPDGKSCGRLMARARRHGVYVCAGLIEQEGARVFNAGVLIGPDGSILLHHRKINELEIGHEYYSTGDRLQVEETPFGTLGLMICADAFAPQQVISRTLAMMGAHVILSPCAWAVPAAHDNIRDPYGQLWRDNYGPVARDFRIWIAGVSNVGSINAGPWEGRKCIGCSLLVGPSGAEVLMGPYGATAEAILCAEIDPVPRPAHGDGWARFVTR